ncbi:gas vesicle protein GvpN [Solidesulfovibrio sp. C21]|uniref:gas vesicle protein GvpN n=1 Tax=Solidesulfovibrio sp. C21 TaxID=3398613 RepID=UPI0039FC4329
MTIPYGKQAVLTTSIAPTRDDKVAPQPSSTFVETPYVTELTERALSYLEVGYPIHFSGPAGTGKTTLAFHVAAKLGQPISLIHGDDEFNSADLIGRESGYHKQKLVDNYIHSVLKTEESMELKWMDNRLTMACRKGYALIYDEFNRSRPEANNVFLSVLEEKILNLAKTNRFGEGYLEVHPQFRAIFTSNPEEYAGVHKTQDALLDRLITIQLNHFDRETEIRVAMAKSGVVREDAENIVDVVRELRGVGGNAHHPTIRACIAIAKILAHRHARARRDDPVFLWSCQDILQMDTAKVIRSGKSVMGQKILETIQAVCPPSEEKTPGAAQCPTLVG